MGARTGSVDLKKEAEKLAVEGNKFCKLGQFEKAVKCFSDAALLNNGDYRIYGNRSYAYTETGRYDLALADAKICINLNPTWVKGYYRLGVATMCLRQYSEAEKAFKRVLDFEHNCPEATGLLKEVRIAQLTDIGMSYELAKTVIEQHGTPKHAMELLSKSLESAFQSNNPTVNNSTNNGSGNNQHNGEKSGSVSSAQIVHNSNYENNNAVSQTSSISDNDASNNNDTFVSTNANIHQPAPKAKAYAAVLSKPSSIGRPVQSGSPSSIFAQPSKSTADSSSVTTSKAPATPTPRATASSTAPVAKGDPLTDPSNPLKWPTIWVGNMGTMTEAQVKATFGKFGKIISFNIMPEKRCAFINFVDHKCASEAMKNLQGTTTPDGHTLLIKFPDKALGTNQTILKKPKQEDSKSFEKRSAMEKEAMVKGVLPNGECYFWRTTGCQYGNTCRYKHITTNKGKDEKPWMKK